MHASKRYRLGALWYISNLSNAFELSQDGAAIVVIDEQALLVGVRRLDPEILTEVHNTYYPAIFRYVTFKVGDRQVAEDLTSEVFVRLLGAVRDRNAPQNTLRGWLYRVASFVVADYHRQKYKVEKTELNENLKANVIDPGEALSKRQSIEELYEAIEDLTDDQQDVIALRYGFEMPIRDVAQTMGKSEGAVKQLQARAVAALSRKLSPRRNL